MRKGRYKHAQTTTRPVARINEQIRVAEVRVIDSAGKQIGIMPVADAILEAKEKGLDLVEIAPKANPPVVKLINYDKYRYQLEKLASQQRKHQKKVEIKGIRLSVRTGDHDLQVKALRAEKFLKEGNKVKIDMFLRGRERGNTNQAMEQIKKYIQKLTVPYVIEQHPSRMGHIINAILAPKQ
jgi:translation initiation factor IF-3